jgi:hypothetical protein
MPPLTDKRFLELLPAREATPIEWYFIHWSIIADAELIGVWDVDFGLQGFNPIDLNPHSSEYSDLREFLRRRGNPVFASTDDVYDHARKVGWPNADKWYSLYR